MEILKCASSYPNLSLSIYNFNIFKHTRMGLGLESEAIELTNDTLFAGIHPILQVAVPNICVNSQ